MEGEAEGDIGARIKQTKRCVEDLGDCNPQTCDLTCCINKCNDKYPGKHPHGHCNQIPDHYPRVCFCDHDCPA